MTDRGRAALRTSADALEIGPSAMRWRDGALEITVDEVSSPPLVSRMRGTITLTPQMALTGVELPLSPDGAHVWRPFAPMARIAVDLEAPGWQWTGKGYFDANFGTRALEADFDAWTWACYRQGDGATAIYDVTPREGASYARAIRFEADGSARLTDAPPVTPFRRSLWAVRRETRADPGTTPRQALAMLDAPFYCRSAVTTTLDGEVTTGIHEALDLRRFRSPLLKPMLAVRVPRRSGWRFPE